MGGIGKTLIVLGLVLVVVGVIFSLAGKLPWLGHLPGIFRSNANAILSIFRSPLAS